MTKSLIINVKGRVQGVGFRYGAAKSAQMFNINGFIQNLNDGSVYIEAEGEENQLIKFLEWCKSGPRFAKVEHVDLQQTTIKNVLDFSIK